jgi:CHASE1-domain containing sensor protein
MIKVTNSNKRSSTILMLIVGLLVIMYFAGAIKYVHQYAEKTEFYQKAMAAKEAFADTEVKSSQHDSLSLDNENARSSSDTQTESATSQGISEPEA